MIFVHQMGAQHLLKPDWSTLASASASLSVLDDKVSQLAAKRAAAAVKKEVKEVKEEQIEDDDEVVDMKSNLDVKKKVKAPPIAIQSWEERFYMDPLTEMVEAAEERLLRRICCERIMSSTDQHHGYLMADVERGDLASFMMATARVIDGHDAARVLAAVVGLVTLKKTKGMSAAEFVMKQANYRQVITAYGFQFDSRLVREALLQGMAHDDSYAIETSLARKDEHVPVDVVISTMLVKSRSIEKTGGGPSGLTGLAAAAGAVKPKQTGVCFNMRDEGKCRFGDRCRFGHDVAGAAKNTKKTSAPRAPGGCYECGEAHSIADCKIFADRKETEAALKAELAEARALVAAIDQPAAIGSMAKINFPKPDASTASSVWGNGY
jgi:hypothetical protein